MQYKNLTFFGILIISLFFIGCNSNKENSFILSGKVPSLKNNYILLSKIENIQLNKSVFIDSIMVNEKGEFNSVYFLEPGIYSLNFDNKKTIQIAANRGQNIKFKGISIEKIKVGGSKDSKILYAYIDFRNESLNRLVKSVRDTIKNLDSTNYSIEKITKLRELEVENYSKHLDELAGFIDDKMRNSVALYATAVRWDNKNLPIFKDLVSEFSEKYNEIEITKHLKQKIDILNKTSIGSFISTIKMPNHVNDLVSLDSIKGTYTLIDFWASWCPPCRTESFMLNKLYKSYNTKGFQIYGISLDSDKDRWLNALNKDQRNWINVSTAEGFKTPVSLEYGITSLPTNMVIDAEGKIIATNVHGKKLEDLITSLFKN